MDYILKLSNQENKDLTSYCKLNKLDINDIIKKSYSSGFNLERYGIIPSESGVKEIVKTEYIEIVKEVPVEKEVIKTEYIEIVKEVPIIDNEERQQLLNKIQNLESEIKKFENSPKVITKTEYVEIPVEKEIIVEKFIEDGKLKEKLESIQNTLQKLRSEILDKDKVISEYESIISKYKSSQDNIGAIYLRGSNLNRTINE